MNVCVSVKCEELTRHKELIFSSFTFCFSSLVSYATTFLYDMYTKTEFSRNCKKVNTTRRLPHDEERYSNNARAYKGYIRARQHSSVSSTPERSPLIRYSGEQSPQSRQLFYIPHPRARAHTHTHTHTHTGNAASRLPEIESRPVRQKLPRRKMLTAVKKRCYCKDMWGDFAVLQVFSRLSTGLRALVAKI